MPIEIKELHIKATVQTGNIQQQPAALADISGMKEKIIAECVEQVLQVLKDRKER
jgi:hypothetical protein